MAPKVADVADLAIALVVLGAIAKSVLDQSFIFTDKVLTGSIIGFGISYLLASRSLRRRGGLGTRRVFIGLAALVSSVWLFEIVWRLWGWETWSLFREQLFTLSFASPWPMGWALMMVSLVFVGVRYMGMNRWFVLVLLAALATFQLWKSAGFPQFPHPEWWPSEHPSILFIPIEYAHAPTPEARASVIFWGEFLNSLTKVFWCSLPGALFLTRQNLGPRGWGRWEALGAELAALFSPWRAWSTRPGAAAGSLRDAEALVPPAETGWPAANELQAQPPVQDPGERTALGHLAAFMHERFADLVDLSMVGVIILVIAIAAANGSFVLTGRVLAVSIVAYGLAFLIASRSLRRRADVGYERVFLAACAMAGGVWLFEAISHYGWVVSWERIGPSLTDFNIRPPALREPFPLMWASIMIALPFVCYPYMRINPWFWLCVVGTAATFAIWLAVGYPSFTDPWRNPQSVEIFPLIPPEMHHPRTPASPGWSYIAFYGAVFAGVAKLFLCTLPACLLAHNLRGRQGAPDHRPPDVLARAWGGAARAVRARPSDGAHPVEQPARSNDFGN